MRTTATLAALLLALPLPSGLGAAAADGDWGPGADDAAFQAMLKSGFRSKGIATLARLDQDATQSFCSNPARAEAEAAAGERAGIEAANAAMIKWPSDGRWLGDWREGEKIAQSGRGLTSTDKADMANGGNCYNCHKISAKEISFGTLGPSLYEYGKTRGTGEDTLRYTWGKIYDSKATNACSNMPRAGHMGIVTEQQIRDLMALLLDPASPVNQ